MGGSDVSHRKHGASQCAAVLPYIHEPRIEGMNLHLSLGGCEMFADTNICWRMERTIKSREETLQPESLPCM